MKFKIIRLATQNIASQRQFYIEKLGLKLANDSEKLFSVQCGETLLEIEQRDDIKKKEGYYHFCFNVFSSLIEDAATIFLPSKGIPLVTDGKETYTVRDDDWNSKSVYFFDADENILEFIARYNLNETTQDTTFDVTKHINCISEIGIAVFDTQILVEKLQENMDVEVWKAYGNAFQALGDEHGLILAVKFDRPWVPTTDHRNAYLPTDVTIQGKGTNFSYNLYKFNFVDQ